MSRETYLELDTATKTNSVSLQASVITDDKNSTNLKQALFAEAESANNQFHHSDTLASSQESSLREILSGSGFNHEPGLPRSHAAIDLFAVLSCFIAMHFVYLGHLEFTSHRTVAFYGATVLVVTFLAAVGLYNTKRLRTLNNELVNVSLCWIGAFAALGLFAFLTKTVEISRVWISTSMILTLLVLLSIRTFDIFRLVANGSVGEKKIVICGDKTAIRSAIQNLQNTPYSRFHVLNSFEITTDGSSLVRPLTSTQNEIHKIRGFIEQQRQSGDVVDQVWIATSKDQSNIIDLVSTTLIDSTVDVCVVPDSSTERLLNGDSTTVGDTKIVNISDISLSPVADQFKRVFDIVLVSCALLLLFIPMIVIAILVKLESKGPAIFRQKRYGVDGTEIEIYKFRSMHVHTDTTVVQAAKGDARVTRLGRILRSSSLDELPQLFNVLLGDMSLIGPRPHASAHNEFWRNKINGYMLRHKVRPGITGWAQVNGWRGETDKDFKMEQRVKYDLDYIKNWSPLLDVKIVVLTVVSLLRDRNVY